MEKVVIATFQDLQKIPTSENGEVLVEANIFDNSIICEHVQRDMEEMCIRDRVCRHRLLGQVLFRKFLACLKARCKSDFLS